MSHKTFIEKFKSIDYKILFFLPFNIEMLKFIHFYLFKDYFHGGITRYKNDELEYHEIEEVMRQVFELLSNYVSDDQYILECVRLVSIIYLYQPFYDGNSRMCLCLLKLLLERRCLDLYIEKDEKKINRDILSVLYTPEDSLGSNTLQDVNQCLLKRLPPKKED